MGLCEDLQLIPWTRCQNASAVPGFWVGSDIAECLGMRRDWGVLNREEVFAEDHEKCENLGWEGWMGEGRRDEQESFH